MKNKESTLQKVIDQVRAGTNNFLGERSSVIASFIIALSGLVLYADKALVGVDIASLMPDKFLEKGVSPDVFIWIVGQTISPLFIILGSILKPYFYAYIVPIYCYVLQFYFILIDYSLVDDGYGYVYSMGISFILILIMHFARTASRKGTELMIKQARQKILKARVEDETN